MRPRLDEHVVALGLAESRSYAESLIRTGRVLVDDQPVEKPGTRVATSSQIRIRGDERRFVSRGGEKLAPALEALNLDPKGKWCVDVGASTGGFTDCLLQHGATGVVAIDVGYGQLHDRLRRDERVRVLERTNARYLEAGDLAELDLSEAPELVTVDVSFISSRLILPALRRALPGADVLVMVKPQFELERAKVGKGGVVRDDGLRLEAAARVGEAAAALGLRELGRVESTLPGPKGNREIFLLLSPGSEVQPDSSPRDQ